MPAPTLPDYRGGCVCNIVPALLGSSGGPPPAWLPAPLLDARQVVLLVIDGLGWEQLTARPSIAPTLTAMSGGPITTVAPSTTSTALTSIATGATPGEHGVIGYRMDLAGDVLNVLRWSTPQHHDARLAHPPGGVQRIPPFLGTRPPVVTKREFAESGFTLAHLAGVRHHGWRTPSTLVTEVRALLAAGERFVYAYYDGVDKVAHEYGVASAHYDGEVAFADRLVADVLGVLPPGAAVVVTADHGQVDVGDRMIPLAADVAALTQRQSGEARFRWLHAARGEVDALAAAATAAHGDVAWVVTRTQVRDEQWFGPTLSGDARDRLGDVALVAHAPVGFYEAADGGIVSLIGRHGSLTSAEMLVPLVAAAAAV
jgi:hypothetical protein